MDRAPAIIIGSGGQDGRLLSDLLRSRGESVIGVTRSTLDITNPEAVDRLLVETKPGRIFYLAANHGSSSVSSANRSTDTSLDNPALTADAAWAVHVTGLIHCCQAMQAHVPRARLFYASSSRIYGDADSIQADDDGVKFVDENTPYHPLDYYGITKAAGMAVGDMYRVRHGLFCSSGILFNHESPLRGASFVTQKLARAAAAGTRVKVGRLSARTDWGAASEYVDAMTKILDAANPADYVIATGTTSSVADFAEAAFGSVNLDYRQYVSEDPSLVGAARPGLAGRPDKIRRDTGWFASTSLATLAATLVDAARRRD